MKVPVLAYHGYNLSGNDYQSNDLVAFASDLATIDRLGLRVIRLATVVDWVLGLVGDVAVANGVALSCDDGTDFDARDLDHPVHGPQRSFLSRLRDHAQTSGAREHELELTCFVIASPSARAQLDARCLYGRDWMSEQWWQPAQASGLVRIQSHGWDHVHPQVDPVAQRDNRKEDFTAVASYVECTAQLACARHYLAARLDPAPDLLAWPWWQYSDYAHDVYMPQYSVEHGFRAAFGGPSGMVERNRSRYALPRLTCGHDWRSPAELEALLLSTRSVGAC